MKNSKPQTKFLVKIHTTDLLFHKRVWTVCGQATHVTDRVATQRRVPNIKKATTPRSYGLVNICFVEIFGCGGRIWTCDLQVMSEVVYMFYCVSWSINNNILAHKYSIIDQLDFLTGSLGVPPYCSSNVAITRQLCWHKNKSETPSKGLPSMACVTISYVFKSVA